MRAVTARRIRAPPRPMSRRRRDSDICGRAQKVASNLHARGITPAKGAVGRWRAGKRPLRQSRRSICIIRGMAHGTSVPSREGAVSSSISKAKHKEAIVATTQEAGLISAIVPTLTVDDLQKSITFYEALGFAIDDRWEEKGTLL